MCWIGLLMLTIKQYMAVIAVGGSIILSTLGFIGVQLYDTVILVQKIHVRQMEMNKILDRVEATEADRLDGQGLII